MQAKSYPAKWSSDEVLKAVEELAPRDAERVYLHLQQLRSAQPSSRLPAQEATLLAKINRGFSEAWWHRFHQLVEKRRAETLTSGELRELSRRTDRLESREAHRLQALVKLAGMRRCTLPALMTDLGLMAKSHA